MAARVEGRASAATAAQRSAPVSHPYHRDHVCVSAGERSKTGNGERCECRTVCVCGRAD
jgi:hypothetical protein